MLPYSTAVRVIVLTITFMPVNCFLAGALWLDQGALSSATKTAPKKHLHDAHEEVRRESA